jgi:hypothetical protein
MMAKTGKSNRCRGAESKMVMMNRREQAERIRALVESFSADRAERERLKREADEALARLHRAVRDLVGDDSGRKAAPSTPAG